MQRVDHGLQFRAEIGLALVVPRRIAGRHVLPDQQAQFVAPVVPAGAFVLDVLASHVHAELLGHHDVVLHRLVGSRRVQTVRPPALIQRAVLEQHFVIQHQAIDAFRVLGDVRLAHAEVAGHGVDRLAVLKQFDLQIVQIRCAGPTILCDPFGWNIKPTLPPSRATKNRWTTTPVVRTIAIIIRGLPIRWNAGESGWADTGTGDGRGAQCLPAGRVLTH